MFSICVRIDGIERRRKSVALLHVVTGLFLLLKASAYYQYDSYRHFMVVFPFLLAGSFSLFYGLFRKKLDASYRYSYWLKLVEVVALTTLGVLLIGMGKTLDYAGVFFFALMRILLIFSERRIFHETNILLSSDGVLIPGYYRDHLVKWEELKEVVIREDFVTFFHVKGKYLQYQVMQDLSTLEVAKMNAFCKEQTGQLTATDIR